MRLTPQQYEFLAAQRKTAVLDHLALTAKRLQEAAAAVERTRDRINQIDLSKPDAFGEVGKELHFQLYDLISNVQPNLRIDLIASDLPGCATLAATTIGMEDKA